MPFLVAIKLGCGGERKCTVTKGLLGGAWWGNSQLLPLGLYNSQGKSSRQLMNMAQKARVSYSRCCQSQMVHSRGWLSLPPETTELALSPKDALCNHHQEGLSIPIGVQPPGLFSGRQLFPILCLQLAPLLPFSHPPQGILATSAPFLLGQPHRVPIKSHAVSPMSAPLHSVPSVLAPHSASPVWDPAPR